MSKKRGFTLVEVLVVIAITTLVFALVGGTFVFLATSSGDIIHKSEAIIQAQTIEKHLRSLDLNDDNKVTFEKADDNTLYLYKIDSDEQNVRWNSTSKILTINGTEYENVQDYNISLFYLNDSGERKDGKNPAGDTFVECAFQLINNNKTTDYIFILGIYTEQ